MNRIVSIQMLRGIAALSVALCHFSALYLKLNGHPNMATPLYPLAAGVDLFFVISGFVMVYTSAPLFNAHNGAKIFAVRRVARIVPIYWIATIIGIAALGLPISVSTLAKSFFFIPYEDDHSMRPILGVGWTLNYEMFFYALFSITLWTGNKRAVTGLMGMLIAIAVIGMTINPTATPLRAWIDPIIIEFAMGMGIALAYRSTLTLPISLRLVMIGAGILAVWFSAPLAPPSGNRVLTWGIPMALVVAGTVLGPFPKMLPSTERLLNGAGDASYAFYLFHGIVGGFAVRAKIFFDLRINNFLYLIVAFAAALIASYLACRFIEMPLTRRLTTSFTRPASKRTDHPAAHAERRST